MQEVEPVNCGRTTSNRPEKPGLSGVATDCSLKWVISSNKVQISNHVNSGNKMQIFKQMDSGNRWMGNKVGSFNKSRWQITFVSLSLTNSTPSMSPWPRTSPMMLCLSFSASRPFLMCPPTWTSSSIFDDASATVDCRCIIQSSVKQWLLCHSCRQPTLPGSTPLPEALAVTKPVMKQLHCRCLCYAKRPAGQMQGQHCWEYRTSQTTMLRLDLHVTMLVMLVARNCMLIQLPPINMDWNNVHYRSGLSVAPGNQRQRGKS